ncbi:predicted protein [Chaetoceros tenuissimus]|uniref:Uncharacterized protein n=1 Tax=Chaetoceros tenuissimus TaxID=426638 RepID=A0AAD3CGL6_9STRA|nr:predicted protein [Chaetoceros tenuissimus]
MNSAFPVGTITYSSQYLRKRPDRNDSLNQSYGNSISKYPSVNEAVERFSASHPFLSNREPLEAIGVLNNIDYWIEEDDDDTMDDIFMAFSPGDENDYDDAFDFDDDITSVDDVFTALHEHKQGYQGVQESVTIEGVPAAPSRSNASNELPSYAQAMKLQPMFLDVDDFDLDDAISDDEHYYYTEAHDAISQDANHYYADAPALKNQETREVPAPEFREDKAFLHLSTLFILACVYMTYRIKKSSFRSKNTSRVVGYDHNMFQDNNV